MLSATIYLDFGFAFPDGGLRVSDSQMRSGGINGPEVFGRGQTLISLTQTVQARNIDFNGNGQANRSDANALASQIIELVRRIYEPFQITVQAATAANIDDVRDTLRETSTHDAYVFVAGDDPAADPANGWALVDEGNDDDNVAFVFADKLLANLPAANRATGLARVVAHESGHTFGLEHTDGSQRVASGDVMATPVDGVDLRRNDTINLFTRYSLPLADGGTQNAFAALEDAVGFRRSELRYVTGTGANDFISITREADGVAAVRVQAFADADRENLIDSISYSVATSFPIIVEAGAGADHIYMDARLGTTVEVRGGAEADILTVNGTAGDDTITMTSNRVTIGTTHIDYTEVEKLRVRADSGNDTLQVLSTALNTPVDLFGGDDDDGIVLGGTDTSLGRLHSRVVVWGGEGVDTLYLRDEGSSLRQTYTVTSTSVTRSGMSEVSYSNVEQLLLNASPFGDTINVHGTSRTTPLTVNSGGGNDTINVGSADNSLATIRGQVFVIAGGGTADVLNLNDHNSGAGLTYEIGRRVRGNAFSGVSRAGSRLVSYEWRSLERLVLNAGAAGDAFEVLEHLGTTDVTANGRGGSDTVLAPNLFNVWNITGENRGNLGVNFAFTSVENLTGSDTFDRFAFSDGAAVSGVIDGGGSSDVLDYRQYTTSVTARLSTGTATGTAGVHDIENVEGGAGNDVLIGDSGTNYLYGRGGRDLVIGGSGVDLIYGDEGEDLLIGGSTDHDANDLALFAILGEWSRGDRTYAERVQNLTDGGGRNGLFRLNLTTVNEDSHSDSLQGGTELDWFFVSNEDRIRDLSKLEQYDG